MKSPRLEGHAIFALLAALALFTSGCDQATDDGPLEPVTDASQAPEDCVDHTGWWCVGHALPEAECSMCSSKAAAKFREEGDWCEEHNRAESQCFKCDPSRADKFVALYEAKFGEKPPQATE